MHQGITKIYGLKTHVKVKLYKNVKECIRWLFFLLGWGGGKQTLHYKPYIQMCWNYTTLKWQVLFQKETLKIKKTDLKL